mmetsp:Transcript_13003/g.25237  ORF Transcript_13003/g.25237 Transcript_13003/m.25237 type:complete len:218 (+) Transcript_13003:150-803(+)
MRCVGLDYFVDLLSSLEALLNLGPVVDVPAVLDVLRATVLDIPPVSVLPHIKTKKRGAAGGRAGVLVSGGDNADTLLSRVPGKPCPARALNSDGLGRELLLEAVKASPLGGNGLANLTGGLTTSVRAGRGKVLPEEAVVHVATSVELERGLKSNHGGHVALGLSISVLLESSIEVSYVRLVVLGVVHLHDLGAHVRLEGAIVVGEVRELEGAREGGS